MEEKEFETLTEAEMAELKGGAWRYVNGEWIWVEEKH